MAFLQEFRGCEGLFKFTPIVEAEIKADEKEKMVAAEFDRAFEDVAKRAAYLNQTESEMIETLKSQLQKMSEELDAADEASSQIKSNIETLMQECERLTASISQQDDEKDGLKEAAMTSFAEYENVKGLLSWQRKLLYLITRLTWDEKALSKNLIKGFVVDPIRNDVSVFKTDRSTKVENPAIISDFLWDYISSTSSATK